MSGMNTILSEQNVHIDEAIKKLKECELKTIQSFSQTSEFAANYVDDYFKDVIAKTPMVVGGNEFKPSTTVVMKFKDTWVPDHTINLGDEIKNRKVMGLYTVRITDTLLPHNPSTNKWFCDKAIDNKYDTIKCNTLNRWSLNGICKKCGNKRICPYVPINDMSVLTNTKINYNTPEFNFDKETMFEIDNYLNIYDPQSKLYILFNIIAYPTIPFVIANNFTSEPSTGDYKFFSVKYINSHECSLFENVLSIIPPNYQNINEICMSFLNITPKQKFPMSIKVF